MNTILSNNPKLKNPEYRKAFVASEATIGLPFQIGALMKARGWTQTQLAEKSGMLQPRISDLLRPGKTRPNVDTLRRVAEAFDVGLQIRFVPFSKLVKDSDEFDPETFEVMSFEQEEAANVTREASKPAQSVIQNYFGGLVEVTRMLEQWRKSVQSQNVVVPPIAVDRDANKGSELYVKNEYLLTAEISRNVYTMAATNTGKRAATRGSREHGPRRRRRQQSQSCTGATTQYHEN